MTDEHERRAGELCHDFITNVYEAYTQADAEARLLILLREAREEGLEEAAKIAENNFPVTQIGATDGEQLVARQCLRIAEQCRAQAAAGKGETHG